VIDSQLATVEVEAVESVDCRLTLFFGAEFAETHSSRSSGFAILKDSEPYDGSEVGEYSGEFVLGGGPGDVSDED